MIVFLASSSVSATLALPSPMSRLPYVVLAQVAIPKDVGERQLIGIKAFFSIDLDLLRQSSQMFDVNEI